MLFIAGIALFNSCDLNKKSNPYLLNRLAGTWHLISRIDKTKNDSILEESSLGSHPIAILNYDKNGNIAVQIMKQNRNDSSSSIVNSIDSNNSHALNGYDAYFGKYTVDSIKKQIKHKIIGSLNPKDVGKEVIRNYYFTNDTLNLWFNAINGNNQVIRTLSWIKEK